MVKANAAPVAVGDAYSVLRTILSQFPGPACSATTPMPTVNPLTAVLNSGSASFSLSRGGGAFRYRPDPNFTGSDSFTYHANDGSVDSNVVTVKITVLFSPGSSFAVTAS